MPGGVGALSPFLTDTLCLCAFDAVCAGPSPAGGPGGNGASGANLPRPAHVHLNVIDMATLQDMLERHAR